MPLIRALFKVAVVVLLLVLFLFLYVRISETESWVCPRVEHIFANEKYDVEECGGGGGVHHFNVRMRVYSKDGVLLGQRNFSVGTEPNTERMEYLSDRITYNAALIDDENGVPAVEKRVLQFPLTKRDWLEANLDRILFSP